MIDFQSKNILITGGSRGIGLASALLFARLGANVAFTYRSNVRAAEAATESLKKFGVQVIARSLETVDEGGHEVLVQEIVERWGSLDVAIANAGIWTEASLDNMTLKAFRETMEINMTGSFVLAKAAAKQMRKQSSGAIVLISSTSGQRGEAFYSHYSASKGAQISFTKSLALELAPHNIRVNSVAPGWTRTEMTEGALHDPQEIEKIKRVIPMQRPGEPEEIANAIAFLASPLASFITGEILNVNGGAVLCG